MTRSIAIVVLCLSIVAPSIAADGRAALPSDVRSALDAGRLREAGDGLRAHRDAATDDARRAGLELALARVEVNLGRYRAGLDAARRALEIYDALDHPAGRARAHFRIATAQDELGRYDDSMRHNALALELFRALGDRQGEADSLAMSGTTHRFIGDYRAARDYYDRSRVIVAGLGDDVRLSRAHRDLALVLEHLDDPGAAASHYRRALELLPAAAAWMRADALFHLGRLLAREGDPEAAVPRLREALALGRRSQNTWVEALSLVELARHGRAPGAGETAIASARAGVELLERMGARDLVWEALLVEGALLERSGEPAAALAAYERALRALDAVRASIGPPMLRSRYTPRSSQVYEAVTSLHWSWPVSLEPGERAARMFATAQRNRARTFEEMLIDSRRGRGRSSAGEGEADELELRGTIHALRTRLIRFPDSVADRDAVERELRDAEQAHASLLARHRLNRSARGADDSRDAPIELDRVLGPGDELVAFQLGERRSFVWHGNAAGLRVFELPSRAELDDLVTLWRMLVTGRADPDGTRRVAVALADTLLGPVLERVEPGARVTIVPDGGLSLLPFEALPIAGADGLRRPWIRHNVIDYAPSLAVIGEIRARTTDASDSPSLDLLAVGDPLLGPEDPWRPLRHAAGEIDAVTRLFRGERRERYTGRAASEATFTEAVREPIRVVHLATHGVFDDRRPERSGLVFSDGFLDLHEIFALRARADLVVLSACDTARGELLRGEGVLGVSRAFLYAGARAAVASLWQVDDASTAELMTDFYRELRDGVPASRALRRAKLARLDRYEAAALDPFGWAAFVLVGDGEVVVDLPPRGSRLARPAIAVGLGLIGVALIIARRRPG